jgi:hypothetical protein
VFTTHMSLLLIVVFLGAAVVIGIAMMSKRQG